MLLGLSLVLVACGTPKRDLRTKPYVKETFTMGTYVKITSYDKGMKKMLPQLLPLPKITIKKPQSINLAVS